MKTPAIRMLAGEKAFQEIQQHGLRPERVQQIVGASGGSKWLVLSHLDQYLTQHFLPKAQQEVALIGSSVGSWRMAIYACSDPAAAFQELEALNMSYRYSERVSTAEIQGFVDIVMRDVFNPRRRREIVNNERWKLHIVATRNRRYLNGKSKIAQLAPLSAAAIGNIFSTSVVPSLYPRVLISPNAEDTALGKPAEMIALTEGNIVEALSASGAIPIAMLPSKIPGGKERWYWDGGITDYHFSGPFVQQDGLVLYPHFSSKVIPGWFDKSLSWRKIQPANFSNVVMLAPSDEFIAGLPHGKIPDRKDYSNFSNEDREQNWAEVLSQTDRLVEELKSALEKDGGRSMVELLK